MTTVGGDSAERAEPSATSGRAKPAGRRQYWVVLLAIYCVGFAIYGALPYVPFDPTKSRSIIRPDIPIHFPILAIHVLTGAIAMSLAWLQVWPWLRDNHPRIHRRIGWVYFLAGVIPSGLLSLPVAALSTAGQSLRMSLFTLGILWLGTTILGFRAALQRKIADHQKWMLRNVALTTVIITARPIFFVNLYGISWLLPDTYSVDSVQTFNEAFATGIWGAFVVHLVFVEWFVLRSRPRLSNSARRRRSSSSEQGS